MKIHNVDFIAINGKQDIIKLTQNSILTAKLIDVVDNEVLLDLGNGNFLSGKTELNLQGLKNSMISFFIKSLDSNKIELKPLLDTISESKVESKDLVNAISDNSIERKSLINIICENNSNQITEDNKEAFIKEILDLYKIEENDTNIETIKSIIKFGMSLSKESVRNVIKYINKLESIITTSENEKLYLLESNQDPLDSDICKIIKSKEDQSIMKQDVYGKSELSYKNIADKLLSQIKSFTQLDKITSQMIKKVTFLLKSDIDVSINNIKLLTDLIDRGNSFEDKIVKIFDDLFNNELINKSLLENFKYRINNTAITFSQQDKENVDIYYKEMKSVIELIEKQIVDKKNISDEIHQKIKEVNNSINLISRLNEHATFFYLPFTFKDDSLKNSFYMLSNKKHMKMSDKISIFMRLNTKNLKEIEVMCIAINDSINLNLKVEKKILDLFEEKKFELNNALKAIGYSNVSIYVNENSNTDILDLLSNNEFLNYKLNVKV